MTDPSSAEEVASDTLHGGRPGIGTVLSPTETVEGRQHSIGRETDPEQTSPDQPVRRIKLRAEPDIQHTDSCQGINTLAENRELRAQIEHLLSLPPMA